MAKQLTLDTVQSFCKERGLKYELMEGVLAAPNE